MTSYSEEGFLSDQIDMLKEAIDYLSKLALQARKDLSEVDENGIPRESVNLVIDLESEVVEQLAKGKKNLTKKLNQAQNRLEQINNGQA